MIGKSLVELVLLMTAGNLVFSCLVTNCPRGGKRAKPDFYFPSNNVVDSEYKKCNLCSPGKEVCLGVYCSSEVTSADEGRCVTQEICCSPKRFCKLQKSCESNFNLRKRDEFKKNSVILTKILKYNF